MLKLRVWAMTLGAWAAVSFTLCVHGGLLFPGLPMRHETLEALLPGFTWISPKAFALGFVESFGLGVYAALLLIPIHNLFWRRWHTTPAPSQVV